MVWQPLIKTKEAQIETDRMATKEKPKWSKRTQCSAINCKNYQCDSTDVAFHRFPKDPDRCSKWVQNLRNASLLEISPQRLNQNYRVCSAHFHASQFKRPSDVHAGLKWNAVPTLVNVSKPPPVDLELKRKPPNSCQELPPKKRSSTAVSVQQPTGSTSETDSKPPDASVAGPSMPRTPPTYLDAATAKEHALKMKIRCLKVQVCKLKAKLREVNRLKNTRKACVNKSSVMEQLKKLLPAKTYAFVSTQIHMSQRKTHGFR
ncbi:52 kDa repressor of the inhibitor of the protein kinase-like isoform X2 [Triplophysa rosa]|uniref:52 kDa repressor of the inhibitor of the protein kinase-like isoform X2 n=1 Tax=Triplophysa rosa TaxID=992332 RepID=UPI0025462705|nr:52 kDa repressor of the inhibitor of the protein kinase-like isoform X2 [Triplophysa rosa]